MPKNFLSLKNISNTINIIDKSSNVNYQVYFIISEQPDEISNRSYIITSKHKDYTEISNFDLNTNVFTSIDHNTTFGEWYKKYRFRHKLLRIQKEFQFANKKKHNFQTLTKREKEIIQLLAKGNNNSDISEILFISRCTVEQHRKNINRKLGIRSFADMIRYFYAFDLI